jgi:hypothetical protein
MEYDSDSEPNFEALLKEREDADNGEMLLIQEEEKVLSSSKQDSADFGSLDQSKINGSRGLNSSHLSEEYGEILQIFTAGKSEVKQETNRFSLNAISGARSWIEESKSDWSGNETNNSRAELFPSRTVESCAYLSVSFSDDSNSTKNAPIVVEQKFLFNKPELPPMKHSVVDYYLESVTTHKILLTKVQNTIGLNYISEGNLAFFTINKYKNTDEEVNPKKTDLTEEEIRF